MSKGRSIISAADSSEKKLSVGRRSFLQGLSALPLLGALPALLTPGRSQGTEAAQGQAAGGTPEYQVYYLTGNYFESCNCDAICPCLLLEDPTHGYCQAFPSWHIEQGRLGEITLDGLNVAAWLHSPGNLTKGNWRLALYIDERATPEQFNAIKELWQGKHGGYLQVIASLVSEDMGVKPAKIDWKTEGKHRVMSIEGIGGVDITEIEGADGGHVVLQGTPLAVAPPHPITVSKSNRWSYHDHGADVLFSGTSGLSSKFTYYA